VVSASAMWPGLQFSALAKGQFSAAADTTIARSQSFTTSENLTGTYWGSSRFKFCCDLFLMSPDIVARYPEASCRLML
jgi:hypothetical protein